MADRRQAGLSRRFRQCVDGLAQLRSQTTVARRSSMHGYKSRYSQMMFPNARVFAAGRTPLNAAALVSDPRWILYDEHSSPRVRADSTSRSIGTKQATSAQQGLAVSSHGVYSASVGVQGVAKPRLVQQDGHQLCPASISFQCQTLNMHTTSTAWRGCIFGPCSRLRVIQPLSTPPKPPRSASVPYRLCDKVTIRNDIRSAT